VVEQQYPPEGLPTGKPYYEPTDHGYEARVRARLEEWERLKHPPEPAASHEEAKQENEG
jgi:replication-associated recombination protein RarA